MNPIEALLRAGAGIHVTALVAQPDGPAHVRVVKDDRPVCGTWAKGLNRANVTALRLCRSCVRVLNASHDHPGKTAQLDVECRKQICVRDVHQVIETAQGFDDLQGVDTVLAAHGHRQRDPLPSTSWTGTEVDDLWALLKQTRSRLNSHESFVPPTIRRGHDPAYWAAVRQAGGNRQPVGYTA